MESPSGSVRFRPRLESERSEGCGSRGVLRAFPVETTLSPGGFVCQGESRSPADTGCGTGSRDPRLAMRVNPEGVRSGTSRMELWRIGPASAAAAQRAE